MKTIGRSVCRRIQGILRNFDNKQIHNGHERTTCNQAKR